MTARKPCPEAPGPLEGYTVQAQAQRGRAHPSATPEAVDGMSLAKIHAGGHDRAAGAPRERWQLLPCFVGAPQASRASAGGGGAGGLCAGGMALRRALTTPERLRAAAARPGYCHRRNVQPLIEHAIADATRAAVHATA